MSGSIKKKSETDKPTSMYNYRNFMNSTIRFKFCGIKLIKR